MRHCGVFWEDDRTIVCPVNDCPVQRRPVRFDHAPPTDPAGHPPGGHRRRYRYPAPHNAGSPPPLVVALSRPATAWISLLHHDELGLGCNGLCCLRDHWVSDRPSHSRECSWRTRRVRSHSRTQRRQWKREFCADRLRRARVLDDPPGTRASRIPPSQSSFPFAIFTVLTEEKPASFSHAVVSATE
jgi:hypothetical protein